MSDIVELMRRYANQSPIKDTGEWIDFASLYLAQGADEIAKLRTEVKFIVEERDRTFALMLGRAEKAEAEVNKLRAALEKVLVGGNHLATIIGATHPQAGCHPEGALQFYGPGHQYDAWCCWNAIMQARAALGERT